MKQRDVFLASEGDAWFRRNRDALGARRLPDSDPLLMQILAMPAADRAPGTRVLEIGCGDGTRIGWLKSQLGFESAGVDPSAEAVASAAARGAEARQGTANQLPFDDGSFDMVIFGFCLYLCDRDDLFAVAAEANRVLRNPGWLLIQDFYSPVPVRREYHHRPGIFSFKMDYRSLFTWSPAYAVYSHVVGHHASHEFTDDPNEWVATSVLRKNLPSC
jgi:ubiquinone/menaquinone biosynthesis C-methylase UbiE